MNDETRVKGNTLSIMIATTERDLSLAREIVLPYYRNSSGGDFRKLPVNVDVASAIKLLVVADLEKQLADLKAEYEAL